MQFEQNSIFICVNKANYNFLISDIKQSLTTFASVDKNQHILGVVDSIIAKYIVQVQKWIILNYFSTTFNVSFIVSFKDLSQFLNQLFLYTIVQQKLQLYTLSHTKFFFFVELKMR